MAINGTPACLSTCKRLTTQKIARARGDALTRRLYRAFSSVVVCHEHVDCSEDGAANLNHNVQRLL